MRTGQEDVTLVESAMRRHASYPNYAHLSNRDYHNTGALQIINYFTSALRAGIKGGLGILTT